MMALILVCASGIANIRSTRVTRSAIARAHKLFSRWRYGRARRHRARKKQDKGGYFARKNFLRYNRCVSSLINYEALFSHLQIKIYVYSDANAYQ